SKSVSTPGSTDWLRPSGTTPATQPAGRGERVAPRHHRLRHRLATAAQLPRWHGVTRTWTKDLRRTVSTPTPGGLPERSNPHPWAGDSVDLSKPTMDRILFEC